MSLNKQNSTVLENSATRTPVPAGVEEVAMSFSQEHLANIVTMLTDLYKDPIGATVRETISNALDSTKKADSELPVEVTRPTAENPVFMVKDSGLGMTKDEVTRVYAQYGASTKIDDFDMIGAKGMGAKAPLSYTTEFEVVSVDRDGMETKAVLTRTDEGNFARISEPTFVGTENQGTTVRIPVLERDIAEFSKNVENYENYSIDLPIMIDGEVHNPADKWEYVTTVILDEESGTTGDVYLNGKNIENPLSQGLRNLYTWSGRSTNLDVTYVLGGWNYGVREFGDKHNRLYSSPSNRGTLAVMLSPGVIDFDTSRDSITNNKRFADLDANVKAQLRENGAEGIQNAILRFYKKLSKSRALADFRVFSGRSVEDSPYKVAKRMAEIKQTGGELVFAPNSKQSVPQVEIVGEDYIHFTPGSNLKFEHFYTDEGFNPAEFLYETVNTEHEGGFLFSVKRASMSSTRAVYEVSECQIGGISGILNQGSPATKFHSENMPKILDGGKAGDISDVETFFYSAYNEKNKNVTAIVDVDVKELDNFRHFNPYLSNLVTVDGYTRMVFTTDKEISETSELFASAGNCRVQVKTFADFVAEGEDFLKRTKKAVSSNFEIVKVYNYDLDYKIGDFDVDVNVRIRSNAISERADLRDAFTTDCDYVILTSKEGGYKITHDAIEVLRYMINNGVITDESAKIRVVENTLRAKDVTSLESYGVTEVYAHPDAMAKASKKLAEFVGDKVGADKSLKSAGENMSENMAIACIYESFVSDLNVKVLRDMLDETGFDASLMGMDYLDDDKATISLENSRKMLTLVIGEDFKKTTKINNALTVARTLKGLYRPYNYACNMYNTENGFLRGFVSSFGYPTDKLSKESLSDPVVKALTEQLGNVLTKEIKTA